MERPFTDRREAGRVLAGSLSAYAGRRDVIVLALPRGGVPVGYEVANALHVPLDVLPVCKLGLPWQAELAMGALSSNGAQYVDSSLVRSAGVSEAQLQSAMALARIELGRTNGACESAGNSASSPSSLRLVTQRIVGCDPALRCAATREDPIERDCPVFLCSEMCNLRESN